jgi:hypothetical protein
MARYFLHLRDTVEELLDEDGVDYASTDELRSSVMLAARDLISADVLRGVVDLRFRIDAEDENGTLVYRLPFKHAFSIVPEAG